MTTRILIADDHQVVRQGLAGILSNRAGFEVVGEAEDGVAAEAMARSIPADLLILDIGLPLRRGLAVCENLRADHMAIPILFFSMYPPSQYSAVARKIGAQGFVGKESGAHTILAAVDHVLAGRNCFGSHEKRSGAAATGNPFASLSTREHEVLLGIVAGQSLTRLAQELGLNTKTLSTYRSRILTKLNVDSNSELVSLAILHGIESKTTRM